MIEEYASKSLYEREEIYFRERIDLLKQCAKTGTLVRLAFQNDSYDMKPYGVIADEDRKYHYLTGISLPIRPRELTGTAPASPLPAANRSASNVTASVENVSDASESAILTSATATTPNVSGSESVNCNSSSESTVPASSAASSVSAAAREHITSVRISQILSVKSKSYRSGRLTKEQRKKIQQLIRTSGVPYISQPAPEEIIVRLTKEGVRKYRKMLHLRPTLIKSEDYEDYSIYHFFCTRLQARFYLFRLGGDTYVLQPKELREELRERFTAAAEAYQE